KNEHEQRRGHIEPALQASVPVPCPGCSKIIAFPAVEFEFNGCPARHGAAIKKHDFDPFLVAWALNEENEELSVQLADRLRWSTEREMIGQVAQYRSTSASELQPGAHSVTLGYVHASEIGISVPYAQTRAGHPGKQ